MKTKYKYIHFAKKEVGSFTIWSCLTNKGSELLGSVAYYKTWKESVYYPEDSTALSHDCLTDIADFLTQLNKGG